MCVLDWPKVCRTPFHRTRKFTPRKQAKNIQRKKLYRMNLKSFLGFECSSIDEFICFLCLQQIVAREILTQFQVWQKACYSRNIDWGPITTKVQFSSFARFRLMKCMHKRACFQRVILHLSCLHLNRSYQHCRSCMGGRQR